MKKILLLVLFCSTGLYSQELITDFTLDISFDKNKFFEKNGVKYLVKIDDSNYMSTYIIHDFDNFELLHQRYLPGAKTYSTKTYSTKTTIDEYLFYKTSSLVIIYNALKDEICEIPLKDGWHFRYWRELNSDFLSILSVDPTTNRLYEIDIDYRTCSTIRVQDDFLSLRNYKEGIGIYHNDIVKGEYFVEFDGHFEQFFSSPTDSRIFVINGEDVYYLDNEGWLSKYNAIEKEHSRIVLTGSVGDFKNSIFIENDKYVVIKSNHWPVSDNQIQVYNFELELELELGISTNKGFWHFEKMGKRLVSFSDNNREMMIFDWEGLDVTIIEEVRKSEYSQLIGGRYMLGFSQKELFVVDLYSKTKEFVVDLGDDFIFGINLDGAIGDGELLFGRNYQSHSLWRINTENHIQTELFVGEQYKGFEPSSLLVEIEGNLFVESNSNDLYHVLSDTVLKINETSMVPTFNEKLYDYENGYIIFQTRRDQPNTFVFNRYRIDQSGSGYHGSETFGSAGRPNVFDFVAKDDYLYYLKGQPSGAVLTKYDFNSTLSTKVNFEDINLVPFVSKLAKNNGNVYLFGHSIYRITSNDIGRRIHPFKNHFIDPYRAVRTLTTIDNQEYYYSNHRLYRIEAEKVDSVFGYNYGFGNVKIVVNAKSNTWATVSIHPNGTGNIIVYKDNEIFSLVPDTNWVYFSRISEQGIISYIESNKKDTLLNRIYDMNKGQVDFEDEFIDRAEIIMGIYSNPDTILITRTWFNKLSVYKCSNYFQEFSLLYQLNGIDDLSVLNYKPRELGGVFYFGEAILVWDGKNEIVRNSDIVTNNEYSYFSGDTYMVDDSVFIYFLGNEMETGNQVYRIPKDNGATKVKNIEKLDIGVIVFPNPTTDVVSVDIDERVFKIDFFDSNGKFIKSTFETKDIKVSEFQSGLYFIRILLENGTYLEGKVLRL